MAIPGLGSLLFQIPAGVLCDRARRPRLLLAIMAVLLGSCYALIPTIVESIPLIFTVLFISGLCGTFFMPLLGTLALSLVGPQKLDLIMGSNRSWNHAGNLVAAIVTIGVIRQMGLGPLFYVAGSLSAVAAAFCFVIRKNDLKSIVRPGRIKLRRTFLESTAILLNRSRVRSFLICLTLFHVANGPLSAIVSLYLKHVGSSDSQIAWMVLVAQPIMIPSAWLAGRYASEIGRKPVFGLALVLLPIRILLYTLTRDPSTILAITALDGIIAGVIGVMVILVCSDLTRGKEGFNSLIGLASTAPALGAMIGAVLQGFLTQHFGFTFTFFVFAAIAGVAALWFLFRMDETGERKEKWPWKVPNAEATTR